MSRYDYECSKFITAKDWPFYALIMTAMRQADTPNLLKLKHLWPDVWDELEKRYHAPGGRLGDEDIIRCNLCGCDDDHACEGGCSWIMPGICSSHAEAAR